MPQRITQSDIDSVFDEYPKLCPNGFTDTRGRIHSQEEIEEGQKRILAEVDQISKAIEWLQDVKSIQSYNARHSSYGLKKFFENDNGSITNGSFIVAAKLSGLRVSPIPRNPNARFNISEKGLKAKLRESRRCPEWAKH